MLVKEIQKLLVNKRWIFYITTGENWDESIGMGGKGILALQFEGDGRVEFPSNMGFYPDIEKWRFDEERQTLFLVQHEGGVDTAFTAPMNDGLGHLVMTNTKEPTKRYIAFPLLDDESNLISEAASIKNIEVFENVLKGDNGKLAQSAQENNVEIMHIENADRLKFLDTIYWYLINRPDFDLGIISFDDEDLSKAVEALRTSASGRLWAQKNAIGQSILIVAGCRTSLLEYLGSLLITVNHRRLERRSLNVQFEDLITDMLDSQNVTYDLS